MSRTVFRVFLLLLTVVVVDAQAQSLQRSVPKTAGTIHLQTAAPTGRVVVKFAADAGVTVAGGGLSAKSAVTRSRLESLLEKAAPGARFEKHITLAEDRLQLLRRRAAERTGAALPDMTLYTRLETTGLDHAALVKLVGRLAADPAVECAFLEPVAVPAALGFDAFTGETPNTTRHIREDRVEATPPVSGDFTSLQGYLGAAPDGVGALAMADTAGALGGTVKVIDVEGAWLWTHEDLPSPFHTIGAQYDDLSWRNHGTAVLGEIRGTDNAFGVRGIVPDCAVGASSIGNQATSDAILNAAAVLDPGDIILIELHGPGPRSYEGGGQFGYMPMEFWQDNFDAIFIATAAGIIVVEAAGNGFQDLDDPLYLDLFDPTVRFSGAIMSGATAAGTLDPADFSNNGQRVDLNGWGSSVTTCAYGLLQGDPTYPETEWYTSGFSGTSSASPIVVGAVAALQGMVEAKFGMSLDAQLARDILNSTGTTLNAGNLIGTRPNLPAAWAVASVGLGEVDGTVTDLSTGLPLEGIVVEVAETGSFAVTATDGSYRIPLTAGAYTISYSSFYYEEEATLVSIVNGGTTTQDVQLAPRPSVDIAGTVYDHGSLPLPGVSVEVLDLAGAADVTNVSGHYTITGLPAGHTYKLLYYGVPGQGARVREIDTTGAGGTALLLNADLAEVDEDFATDDGGFAADSLWAWGTPTAGPLGGFGDANCWGIGMTGNYPDDYSCILNSPAYNLMALDAAFLSFHYWMETEAGFDGVVLEAWRDTEWEVLVPQSEYTDLILGGLGNTPGWAGDDPLWRGAVFDVSDWAGNFFFFRLRFGSDSGVSAPGFWVDDFCIWPDGPIVAVEDGPVAARAPHVDAYPNPFNPATTIEWSIPAAGRLLVDVHDVRGRLVRVLADEHVDGTSGTLTWNGRDTVGRAMPSGVYLVRVRDGAGAAAMRRVLLAK